MNGFWKSISEYPFDQRGTGPTVMISFVRDGGRTTRVAFATRDAAGSVKWHCSEGVPAWCAPDVWLDNAIWNRSIAAPDYASAIAQKIEELTVKWPSREPRSIVAEPSVLVAAAE